MFIMYIEYLGLAFRDYRIKINLAKDFDFEGGLVPLLKKNLASL